MKNGLISTCIRCIFNLKDTCFLSQLLKLGRQIQMVAAQASLAWVCKMTAQYPELLLDSLDAVKSLEKNILIEPFNHNLEKPSCCNETNG